MRAHGPLARERFGDGDLEGWSAMQFIETSTITVHTDCPVGRLSAGMIRVARRPVERVIS